MTPEQLELIMQAIEAGKQDSAKLSEYGVAGIVLAILFPFIIGLVMYTIRTSNRVLREKDAELIRVNERRVETAVTAVEAINDIEGPLRQVVKLLQQQNGGGGDKVDDTQEDLQPV